MQGLFAIFNKVRATMEKSKMTALPIDKLKEMRENLQEVYMTKLKEKQEEVIEQIRQLMLDYEITPDMLGIRTASSSYSEPKQTPKTPPKYRDPLSGATWSGRGRAPLWIKDKDYKDFLIDAQDAVK